MVLTVSRGLDARSLAAIRRLESEVVAHDGGRLKLEHAVLESREPDRAQDALWWEGERLVGFAGLYAFGPPDCEVAGMVASDRRRTGIASALLEAVLGHASSGYARALLVTPAGSDAGRGFAASRGATFDHAEHFLVLGATPDGPDRDTAVLLRPAEVGDREAVRTVLTTAFGHDPGDRVLDRDGDTTYVIVERESVVGTLRLSVHGQTGGVYGFAVLPEHQGRGIGRDVLERSCRLLRAQGCARVTLEVETQNEGALGLYTSVGFQREAGEDYWAVPLPGG